MSDQGNIQTPWEAAGVSRRTWYRWRQIERGDRPRKGLGSRGNYSNGYYMKHRDRFRGNALSYHFRNIERILHYSAKSRAKKRGIPFDIEMDDIVVPDVCPVLGIPLYRVAPVLGQPKRNHPNAPSLDRIRPDLGYVKGNVQVISWRANDLKKDATLEELKALVFHLQKLEDQ